VRVGIAKCGRWAKASVRDTDPNGLDDRGDVALRATRLDVRQGRPCDRLKARTIAATSVKIFASASTSRQGKTIVAQ